MGAVTPIDVVIPWVDGNDPHHKKKISPYLSQKASKSDDIAGATRYTSVGEIFYCVGSVLRFAPFVRTIYIITDGQNPDLDDFVIRNFPESTTRIEIIDHAVILKGYETYLPVFNSRAIETSTCRIPGLAEKYIYMNDDFFFVRPVKPTDFFDSDKSIAYGNWRNIWIDSLLWLVKPIKNGHKPVGFKDSMIKAARLLGRKWSYFHIGHTPHALQRNVLEDFYRQYPQFVIRNVEHKFRHARQFNTQAMFYMWMHCLGRLIIKPTSRFSLYMKPVGRDKTYVERKIRYFEQNNDIKFFCAGSLDQANQADREKILKWLEKLLKIQL